MQFPCSGRRADDTEEEMSRIRIANFILLAVAVVAAIPLTIAVFGDMDPDVITVSAVFVGIGLVGNCICAIACLLGK